MSKKDKIVVLDYDPNWAIQFEEIKTVLLQHIDIAGVKIEHVGSTSIPGLKAKPIIDLDIIIENDPALMQQVIDKLSEIGYRHVGDLGVTGREAFKKLDAKTPNVGTGRIWFKHHLYLCKKQSLGLQNHLSFRDYLRNHPEKIKAYGELKQALAQGFPYDIDAYIDGKTAFIVDILNKAGMKKEDAQQINDENRLK